MTIKWNRVAIKQLVDALEFIEQNDFYSYAIELERNILSRIQSLPKNPVIYPLDKYKRENDGTYHAFEIDNYRVSYRNKKTEIRILRIRHTSRRTQKY